MDNYDEKIEDIIDYTRDYNLDFFGFKTLERGYLLRLQGGKIVERPQHLWMRVALGIHGKDYEKVYADSDRDYWMKAKKALEYGMIDEILTKN